MIWLANGASVLYQWERGVTVNCDKPCDVLSVWREDDKKAKRIVPAEVQGVYRIEIPRQLLQQSGYLRIEAIDAADDGERVIDTARIIIRPRKKPDDYPANGGEAEYWQSLNLRMNAIERKAREGEFDGEKGDPGVTPHIGANGNWYLGDTDTGVHASGVKGAPYIGENGNWWFNGVDSGVQAKGEKGEKGDHPIIGENGNWWVGGEDTGVLAGDYAVGDILETFRTDLGDDWLLCNGAGIPEGEFPALREMIPYNTEWVEAVPGSEYMHVSPIPNTHKWVRVKRKVDSSTYAWDKAEVYDAETRTSLTVECPLVVSEKTVKLVGITHDGAKYVLAACCYGEKKEGRYTMHLYASDDLTAWTQFYTYTLTDTAYPSDITFDGASYLLADGYVAPEGSSSSNYGRYVWVTPADLSGTTRLYGYGGGYKDPRFRPCPQGYFSWDSNNGSSVDIYRANTAGGAENAERVMSGGSSYYPKNVAYFSDRYLITVSHSGSGELDGFEVFDWTTETKTKMEFSTLFDLATNLGSRVLSTGAEYDPLLNEWSIYFKHSSTFYRANISADADPTVKGNYKKTVIKAYPDGYQSMLTQMSTNRARCYENKFRDPSLKCLPEQEGIKYMYVYGGKEHVGKPVELEYIESTGTQYIDTGIIGKTGLEIEIDFEFTEIGTASQIPVGSMAGSSNRIYPLSSGNYVGYGDYVKLPMTAATNERYDIYCKLYAGEQTVTVNGTTIYAGLDPATYDSGCSMLLFAASNAGSVGYHSKVRVKKCKIREGGELVRDYVPCRLASGVVCMYDRVSGEYAMNKGAGKFIAGAEVGVLEEETT